MHLYASAAVAMSLHFSYSWAQNLFFGGGGGIGQLESPKQRSYKLGIWKCNPLQLEIETCQIKRENTHTKVLESLVNGFLLRKGSKIFN